MSESKFLVSREAVVNNGTKTMLWLMAGPAVWEQTPAPSMPPEHISTSLLIAMAHPGSMSSTWIDTQRSLCLALVQILIQDVANWATENDRPDLFATVAEMVEQAVLASSDEHG